MITIKRPERSELLIPAGSLDKLMTAVLYGADAVYCGTPDLSLRTKSDFSIEDLVEGIEFAHNHKKRVYLTLNLYTHNKDIEKLPQFIETIKKVKPDGVIIADPGVFQYVKENAPELELHISTQANVCSYLTVDYWKNQGASLAVLAREVPFQELKTIREKCPDIKLEAFVHGAMCMSYSGRCLLSNFMAERGANQGNCAHDCRWHYKVHMKLKNGKTEELTITDENRELFEFFLEEEYRPNDLIPIEEFEDGTYFMNSKDLCLMPVLDDYIKIGIDSLKVEGRHKNQFYAASVTRAYRSAIDAYYENPTAWRSESYMAELNALRSRGYTLAFHNGRLTNHAHDYDTTASLGEAQFGGFVRSWEESDMIFEVRNTLQLGDVLEFLPPRSGLKTVRLRLTQFINAKNGKEHPKASPGQAFALRIPVTAFDHENPEELKELLPPLTVARSEMFGLSQAREEHIAVRNASLDMEAGTISEEEYQQIKATAESKREKDTLRQRTTDTTEKSKEDACCGRGCNGCLKFWNDDKYTEARARLKKQNDGNRLKEKQQ